jgi:hypothetical protein
MKFLKEFNDDSIIIDDISKVRNTAPRPSCFDRSEKIMKL